MLHINPSQNKLYTQIGALYFLKKSCMRLNKYEILLFYSLYWPLYLSGPPPLLFEFISLKFFIKNNSFSLLVREGDVII